MKKFRFGKGLVFCTAIVLALVVGVGSFIVRGNLGNSKAGSTYTNGTMLQGFEWHITSDGTFWNTLSEEAEYLGNAGFTSVWLPPAQKSSGSTYDVGYGVYDLYDLGEFDQKGTVRTKYGTKQQYLDAIDSFHNNGMQVYADIVLNQRMSGDETEVVSAYQVNPNNRYENISSAQNGTFYTKFTFAGRNGKYSSFIWDANCFDGVDYEATSGNNGIYRFANKSWDSGVSTECGNFDYLMGADVDLENSNVVNELTSWGKWFVDTADLDGFRLDAVKHMSSSFYKNWLTSVRSSTGKELFTVGEYMSGNTSELNSYLSNVNGEMSLFDFSLHYRFAAAGSGSGSYDMSQLTNDTLTSTNSTKSVTFVDNHDTQAGRSDNTVADWFKPMAYCYILTRQEGYPCVFYGDYYGTANGTMNSFKSDIDDLMVARTEYAYGNQNNYLTGSDVVGWSREGDSEHSGSGLAALITDANGGSISMYVGTSHAGQTWYDMTGHCTNTVTIDNSGHGYFSVANKSYSVWINKDYPAKDRDTDIKREVKDTITIYFERPYWWDYNEAGEKVSTAAEPTVCAYIYDNGGYSNAAWPGEEMTYLGDGLYSLTMDGTNEYKQMIINDGDIGVRQSPYANNAGFTVLDNTYYDYMGVDFDYSEVETTPAPGTTAPVETAPVVTDTPVTTAPVVTDTPDNAVTIYYYTGWTNAYIHYKLGDGSWTTVPGVELNESDRSGYKTITIDMESASTLTCCFNNGSGNWDSNNSANYTLEAGVYSIKNTVVTKEEVLTTPTPVPATTAPVETETPVPATTAPVETETPVNAVTIYYYTGWTNAYIHYRVGTGSWTTVPGEELSYCSRSGYKTITIDLGTASNLNCCFNNGSGSWDNNNSQNYTLTAGTYSIKNTVVTEEETIVTTPTPVPATTAPVETETPVPATTAPVITETPVPATTAPVITETPAPATTAPVETETPGNTVTLYYYTGWTNAYIHYRIGSGSWTTAPGELMSASDYSGYRTITIDLGSETQLTCCFNNGSGTWDSNNSSNYSLSAGVYSIKNTTVTVGEPEVLNPSDNTVTIYYSTSWSTAYIHYMVEGGSWTVAPGVAMNTSDVSGYKTITINLGTAESMTACFNNGSGSWDSKNGSNYSLTAGTYTINNCVVSSGVAN